MGERPAEPNFSIISEPLPERRLRPLMARPTVELNGKVPPLELVSPDGERRWVDQLAGVRPLVLLLAGGAADGGCVQLCTQLRAAGANAVLVSRDGAGGTIACAAAFGVLGEGLGGAFVIDTQSRLRLAYAPAAPGEWLPAGVITARLRRLACG